MELFTNLTKNYFTQSHFTSINNLIKSKFGCDEDMMEYSSQDIKMAFMLSNLFILILIVLSICFGFIAVGNICNDTTERGKNTRLGLYVLLILTGGQVGWIYILLWLLKIDICT